ncbi:HAMP domain-containing histidine kinase [Streptosporangium sp. NBC_01755]|uniref:sensor histidine kinase n=1 Tax=unclassified Streptosporangium TaxID=2632669 RepID=UPI002DDAD194|nr:MULTISPECIES: HAMP domain-containing sensor histidine kinase [unclassified Streptosporangium]WSA26637.1 HAMP domain-containing histidine kinase [Streptosporangium sp. NBC_01810]WSD01939.1 HAMP domain-containing histidine kinase [Streptosporangium sp. NBC_01755]
MRDTVGLCDYVDDFDTSSDLGHGCHKTPGHSDGVEVVQTVARTLKRLGQALQQQRRFASDASHELRGPVAALRVELEEAQLHPGDHDLGEVLGRALSDVDRLEAIIADLLALSRAGENAPIEWEPVDLAQLVRTEVFRRADRFDVQLRLAPGVNVNTVRLQLARVLTNLLDNAQRHAERVVRVEVTRNAHTAELAVSDDGAGIAEADRERIFERFTRLDAARSRDRGGTGLGLAIAREIAEGHRGTLQAEDSPIGGACFVLRLPLTDPSGLPFHDSAPGQARGDGAFGCHMLGNPR